TVAGFVVYRIQTDMGELVIETVDDDIEVVVKQGGKVVTIYDPKSGQKLILRSGTYELELKGNPTRLKLDRGSVTLKRGAVKIANIVRMRKDNEPEVAKVGEVWRYEGHPTVITDVAVSPDGRHVLSASGDFVASTGEGSVRLLDARTGKLIWAVHHRQARS